MQRSISNIREKLQKLQFVATSTMHKMDHGMMPDPEGETFQALKEAMGAINPSALSRLEAAAGKPVAAFGEDTDHICDLLMQLHGEFYGKDKAHADAFRSLPKVVAFIKSHPSPSPVPVELSVEDVSKMAEQIQNKARGFGQESMNHRFEGALDTIRHIIKRKTNA